MDICASQSKLFTRIPFFALLHVPSLAKNGVKWCRPMVRIPWNVLGYGTIVVALALQEARVVVERGSQMDSVVQLCCLHRLKQNFCANCDGKSLSYRPTFLFCVFILFYLFFFSVGDRRAANPIPCAQQKGNVLLTLP